MQMQLLDLLKIIPLFTGFLLTFAKNCFQALLFDIPGTGHQDCSRDTLEKVLNYLDTGR
jgi:hypothetical protein